MNRCRFELPPDSEAAIRAAGVAVNAQNPLTEEEIRTALPTARASALTVMPGSESKGWQVGQFTGLNISPFQNWLYEKNREWRFTDGTLCVLWCLEFPEARSDYAKHHKYIQSTRRDYNGGRHHAPAPPVPSVAYDRLGHPIGESRSSQRPTSNTSRSGLLRSHASSVDAPQLETRAGSDLSAVSPVVRSQNSSRTDSIRLTTNAEATSRRLAALQAYMDAEVLGPSGFLCESYGACRQSHAGSFFEGQLHHVGQHYDLSVDGCPLRIVVVGQEYGNGPSGVTLHDRYQDVAIRSGLQKYFKKDGLHDGRNPHMRGTTSVLRLLLGRDPGDRHDEEFWDVEGRRLHLFDMFALVNFLLCSAIGAGASTSGSKPGRSTPIMRRNCSRHFIRTIEILEPTVVIVQGKGVSHWMTSVMRDEGAESEILRNVRIGNHKTLVATLSHPSAQGSHNWADLSRPYLHEVVVPTVVQARRLLFDGSRE